MIQVSVVVPIYNAAPYLRRCVISLMEQVMSSIEFIFIDDASTDNSVEILQQTISSYPHRLSQIHVLRNSHNLGISESRRIALSYTKGDFVGWCDADDWVAPDMFRKLYNAIQLNHAEIALCNYYKVEKDNQALFSFTTYTSAQLCIQRASNNHIFSYNLWNQLIRRDIATKAASQVAPCSYGEDIITLLWSYYWSSRVAFVDEPLYYYNRNNPSSVMNSHRFCYNDWLSQQHNIEHFICQLSKDHSLDYTLTCNWLPFKIKEHLQSVFPDLRSYYNEYSDSYRFIMHYDYLTISVRIKLLIIYSSFISFWLYNQWRNLFK